jgi:hypothetical protein
MRRPSGGRIARITKIYDRARGFDCMNKAGICELGIRKNKSPPTEAGGVKQKRQERR